MAFHAAPLTTALLRIGNRVQENQRKKDLLFPPILPILQTPLAVKVKAISRNKIRRSVLGAAMAVLCGLMLWNLPLGQAWINASYDYLFPFGTRAVTNNVTLIMMDNEAYAYFHQTRLQPWDRTLHTQLLNKLADDGCALVVMDCFFREPGDQAQDEALAKAMRRQRHIVLMTGTCKR